MNGDSVMMVIKTLYGVVPYSGTMMLALTWFGIAVAFYNNGKGAGYWLFLALAALGYAGLFLMLAILATGNPMLGQETNAWLLRTFTMAGFVFLGGFTWSYLMSKRRIL